MKKLALTSLVAGMLAFGSAHAAFVTLAFDPADGIAGENTTPGQEGTIPVLAVSDQVTNAFSGGSSGGGGGKAVFGDLSVVKALDSSSPELFIDTATGKHLRKATLKFYRSEGTTLRLYFSIVLTEVLITGFETGGNALTSAGIRETVTMNFVTITLRDEINNKEKTYDRKEGK
jgi:type VI secretion system secreted protein Hcp